MDYPTPKKKSKDSTTLSMEVGRWKRGQVQQSSPVQRINGFPWRLVLRKSECGSKRYLIVKCLKSDEAELWECSAYVYGPLLSGRFSSSFNMCKFRSWDTENEEREKIPLSKLKLGMRLEVEISSSDDGDKWRLRPVLGPLEPRDGVLVIGDDKQKIEVNKESLASQSSFFDRLFNSDFREKNMTEIPIGDVEYEEFDNVIGMIYGRDDASLTDENVHRVLELADRFDLKIVEDKVVSYLLSSSSSLSVVQKFLIAQDYNLHFLKTKLLDGLSIVELKKMSDTPVWNLLSNETTQLLFKKSCSYVSELMFPCDLSY